MRPWAAQVRTLAAPLSRYKKIQACCQYSLSTEVDAPAGLP